MDSNSVIPIPVPLPNTHRKTITCQCKQLGLTVDQQKDGSTETGRQWLWWNGEVAERCTVRGQAGRTVISASYCAETIAEHVEISPCEYGLFLFLFLFPSMFHSHSSQSPFRSWSLIPIPAGFPWDSHFHWESHPHGHLYNLCLYASPVDCAMIR